MDRTDIEECECPVEGHMTGCPNDLWAKALCDLERGKEPVATVVDELCDLALRGLERGAEPVAWMTAESMSRIEKGGNGSRQTVPVHSKPSCVAKIPLYASAPPADSVTILTESEQAEADRLLSAVVKCGAELPISLGMDIDNYLDGRKL